MLLLDKTQQSDKGRADIWSLHWTLFLPSAPCSRSGRSRWCQVRTKVLSNLSGLVTLPKPIMHLYPYSGLTSSCYCNSSDEYASQINAGSSIRTRCKTRACIPGREWGYGRPGNDESCLHSRRPPNDTLGRDSLCLRACQCAPWRCGAL